MTYNMQSSQEVYSAMKDNPNELYPVTLQRDTDGTLQSYRYGNIEGAGELHYLPGTAFMRQQELVTKQVFRALEGSPINFSLVEFGDKYGNSSDLVKGWDEIKSAVDTLLSQDENKRIAA